MNAPQNEQDHGRAEHDEPSEEVGSWDGEYEEKEQGPSIDHLLDDPRRGQARLINRRFE